MRHIILFSSVDWLSFRQMHHQLADSFVKNNDRVLFIDNTGVRDIKIRDYKRVYGRIKTFVKSIGGFTIINTNLTTLSPILFPFPYSKFFLILNDFILRSYLNKWRRITNFNDSIVITFLPTPLIIRAVNKMNPKVDIYYCANNMSKGSHSANKLLQWEKIYIKKADLVFTISKNLFDKSKKLNNNTYNFPPGVDFERFTEESFQDIDLLKNIKQPILGYVGGLSNAVDYELIYKISQKFLNCSIVLIGPIYSNIKKISNIKNIHILGEVDNILIPTLLSKFTIGLIPYVKNEFTDSVYSCKISEYLSKGLPVVSVNLDEIVNFNKIENNILDVAISHEDFLSKINKNLISNNKELLKKSRINVAKNNSWKRRFDNLNIKINEKIDIENLKIDKKNIYIMETLIYLKKFNFKQYFLIFIIIYFMLFYSPIFNILGNKLILEQQPFNSDAIVVFSGDGYSTYINPGYQKRAIDALKYYFNGYAKKIILSSGRDNLISEVEILRSILIKRGVPNEDIIILNKYPSNTYENVILVNSILSKNKFDSIIFITAPFHSLRAKLIWNKNFPNIKVISVKAMDSSIKKKEKRSFKEIYIISYEYLSIVYNRYKKRL